MAKYKIRVKVIAAVEYEVEVDAATEGKAQDEAIARDQDNLPSDFQVNKGYITDFEIEESEQMTFDCVDCGGEFPMDGEVKPWSEDDEYCAPCGAKIEAAEKAGK